VLAFVYPGLGHVYLREWLRALLWFLLSVSTAVYVFDDSALQSGSLDAVLDAQASLPLWAAGLLLSVTLFSIVDAYWLASRDGVPTARETAGVSAGEDADASPDRCANCGKSLDDEYEFCPWCAAER
jgi:uncharacterized paraquat-inducible protein A